jgi:predicted RNA-binding Zn-ribbon protein involved in translation (DUF1610 family)
MIEGMNVCECGGDSLPDRVWLTNEEGKSELVFVCPECGGQILSP